MMGVKRCGAGINTAIVDRNTTAYITAGIEEKNEPKRKGVSSLNKKTSEQIKKSFPNNDKSVPLDGITLFLMI